MFKSNEINPRGSHTKAVIYCLLLTCVLLITHNSALTTVHAQSATATLSGTVVDQNGAVVPGTDITIINTGTGLQRQTKSNDEGNFTVPLLPPSTYSVRAQHTGFSPIEVTNVVLNVGDQKALQIQLKAGDVNAEVQVTNEAPLINESPTVSTVVDRRFVENMPLNGRSFQTLLMLTPGVVLTASNTNEQGQFSVNGQRANANYFMVDGVSANVGTSVVTGVRQEAGGTMPALSALGGTNSLVSVDAMQEFRVQTSIDFALRRTVRFTEKANLQFRAEFFNIFNHPNFSQPVSSITSSLFGQPTQMLGRGLGSGGSGGGLNPLYQVGGPRSVQLALRVSF